MSIKNRIADVRIMRLGDLRPNPKNWREHPEAQREAFRGVLEEVGWAGMVLAYDPGDGEGLMLVDGHLRTSDNPDLEVPVAILDVNEREADYLMATYDPLAAMATAGREALDALLRNVNSGNAAIQAMLSELAVDAGVVPPAVDFKEYDESVEGDVEYLTCPNCGHKWSQ